MLVTKRVSTFIICFVFGHVQEVLKAILTHNYTRLTNVERGRSTAECQIDPALESPLLLFGSLVIFVLSTTPQSTQEIWVKGLPGVIAVELNASQKRRIGVGMNRSPRDGMWNALSGPTDSLIHLNAISTVGHLFIFVTWKNSQVS